MREKAIKICDECESEYFAETSKMMNLCPDCSHHLYGYENCKHKFVDVRCTKCFVEEEIFREKANVGII